MDDRFVWVMATVLVIGLALTAVLAVALNGDRGSCARVCGSSGVLRHTGSAPGGVPDICECKP